MAVEESTHSKETKELHQGFVRRATISTSTTPLSAIMANRVCSGPNTGANVTNPRFNRHPDPFRCHPPNGEQYHEVIARDPNCSVWRRRDEPEFANRRLSHAGPAVVAENDPLSLNLPVQASTAGLPQEKVPQLRVDVALSVVQDHVASSDKVPEIIVSDADKGDTKKVSKELSSKQPADWFYNNPPSTPDSDTSSGGEGSRAKLGWEAKNSVSKVFLLLTKSPMLQRLC